MAFATDVDRADLARVDARALDRVPRRPPTVIVITSWSGEGTLFS